MTLQVVVIFAIIIFKVSVLTGGTDVLLKIAPVDPRDILRGDYATFQYDISNIDSYYAQSEQIRNGDAVYVALQRNGKYYTAQSVQKTKPTGNELFIKGRVESGGTESEIDPFSNRHFGGSRLHIIYGIEQYFIPEGTGQNFSFWGKEAAARVAIDENGNAALKEIYVDDKPWP